MYDDPKSKINQLEKVLDAREDKVSKKIKRHELHDHESNIPQDWDDSEFVDKVKDRKDPSVGLEVNPNPNFSGGRISIAPSTDQDKALSFSMKILIGSIIFFLIAISVVLFKFLIGGNIVSGDNIEVTVKAPVSVASGETISLEIEIKNSNSVDLLGADLGIIFPAGIMQADDISIPLKRSQISIGSIAPGQSVRKNIKVIILGSEDENKTFKLTLGYKVTGSNSLFNKNKSLDILVTSAPVSLVVTGPTEINANQSVSFSVDVISNSTSVVKDLLLKVEYPFGFVFGNSSPNTFSKNNLWLIGDLAPGEKRTIKFSGMINGQEGEERGFNFNLGNKSKDDSNLIETLFTSSFSSITIRRPFVSADVYFNSTDTSEYIIGAGEDVKTLIKWQNNLAYQISDVSINVQISGNALDKSSVQVENGFYRSSDNVIIFDKNTDKVFGKLDPGQSGEVEFNLKSFSVSSVTGAGLTNPIISLIISVKGKTLETDGDIKDIAFTDFRKIKITSNPRLFAKSLYYIGPFKNIGPVPPKSEKETTYTITWTVTNPLNNLSSARATAVLPTYVKWLNVISPSSEKISYDENTRQLIWNIGNISAGAGTISPAREVSFQVSLLPSVSQIGSAPDLVNEATLTARDNFTLTNVSSIFQAVNTRLSNDPYFGIDSADVTK